MFRLVLYLFVALLLFVTCNALLQGKLRNRENSGSNVLQSPRFMYPVAEEPPRCKTDLGYPGLCIDVRFCSAAKWAVQAGNHPVRCGWIDHYIPKVCCHPDHAQHPKIVLPPARYRGWHRG